MVAPGLFQLKVTEPPVATIVADAVNVGLDGGVGAALTVILTVRLVVLPAVFLQSNVYVEVPTFARAVVCHELVVVF
jgi:hypothetical protein